MKKSLLIVASFCLMGAAVLTTVFMSACEDGQGTFALEVEPKFADLTVVGNLGVTNSSNSQTFEVTEDSLRELSLPLTWRVSDPSLGSISTSGGRSAAYKRTNKHGDNGIFVEDQYGAQGSASVRQ